MDSIRTGGLTLDGNVPSVFLGLLPGMGADGEWTSRVLFPVPKAQWPRHGHAGALLQSYRCRTRIVAWARAAFEQGALPSLLLMPGIAPVPGDRMFQAIEVVPVYQRPAIMHAHQKFPYSAPKGNRKFRCLFFILHIRNSLW